MPFDPAQIIKEALWLVLVLSAPPLLIAVTLGVLTAFIQAIFQIQDQTLPFTVKLVSVTLTLILIGAWGGTELLNFSVNLFKKIPLT